MLNRMHGLSLGMVAPITPFCLWSFLDLLLDLFNDLAAGLGLTLLLGHFFHLLLVNLDTNTGVG